MNENQVKAIVEQINYPQLNRSIVELKLIDKITIQARHLEVVLAIHDESVFEKIGMAIKQSALNEHFTSIDIKKKSLSEKKILNYGHTNNPNNKAPYAKKVIAVTSGKGGVGKSTISANLAVSLAQEGYSVGLLDADVYGPNIPRLLGVQNEKMQWNENGKIVPSENFGIKIMSVALTTPSEDTPLVWRSSVAVSALIQFLEDVQWGELDFLVIDMPPGTGDVQLTMAQELPIAAAVLVTTPELVALDDVSRAIMMFKDINVPIAGLVENMSYFIAPDTQKRYDIFGQGSSKKICEKYNIAFLGEIPLQIQIREMCDEGKVPVALGDNLLKAHYKVITENLFKSL